MSDPLAPAGAVSHAFTQRFYNEVSSGLLNGTLGKRVELTGDYEKDARGLEVGGLLFAHYTHCKGGTTALYEIRREAQYQQVNSMIRIQWACSVTIYLLSAAEVAALPTQQPGE